MNKFENPPCNDLKALSFIMPDERKRKVRIVVEGESSRHLDGSGATPEVGVPFFDQFPPDLPIVHEAVVRQEVRSRVEDEGTKVDDESEIISVGGPQSIVGACESESVTFEEAVGRAGLISETETVLVTAELPNC